MVNSFQIQVPATSDPVGLAGPQYRKDTGFTLRGHLGATSPAGGLETSPRGRGRRPAAPPVPGLPGQGKEGRTVWWQ